MCVWEFRVPTELPDQHTILSKFSLQSCWHNLVTLITKQSTAFHCVCMYLEIVGILLNSLTTVLVLPNFLLNIPCLAQKGEFPIIRHNETEVASYVMEVQVEPGLQLISGEQFQQVCLNIEDGAHLDIAANGFWDLVSSKKNGKSGLAS